MSNKVFELFFGLLITIALLGSLAFLSWVAIQFNSDFLVPFIGSSLFWLMAAMNFRGAMTSVEDTGYRYTRVERAGSLICAVCQFAVTIPFFLRNFPHPIIFSIGMLVVMAITIGLRDGLPALMQKNPPHELHTEEHEELR